MDPVFTATVRQSATGPVVGCAGEIDLDGAPRLRAALTTALAVRPAPAVIVVDLAAVTFCDSSGLNVLLKSRTEAGRQGTALHLARPCPQVEELLRITGVGGIFPVDRDVAATEPQDPAG
ncbi:STAS domain-containing protein [Kitasatospora sp. NBC_01539]|uniref:STAS domain-containing protein n=1 Tax=Kitasatospora sp. NBC_01539 TaxID=2903577 RepID=UPI003860284D